MTALFWLLAAILAAVLAGELVRMTRIIIAYIKGDDNTINRLTHNYEECEKLALRYYECDSETFSKYWKVVLEKDKDALPWDALELCAWEYEIMRDK